MSNNRDDLSGKVALITGAARRVGAAMARTLHHEGMNLALHYHTSHKEARALQSELNEVREESVVLIQADLLQTTKLAAVVKEATARWKRLDVVINNASTFYPTPLGSVTEDQWDNLMGTNLKAPFFLSQAAARHLKQQHGCIINIVDIHGERPLKEHPVYCTAKAGLVMLSKALARELGPEIRVNAIAPGAIMWPENGIDDVTKKRILSRTTLKRQGSPDDIARAALFLIRDAGYVSGQTIAVDGGRSLSD
ncbi:FolM Alternative dihydrofolate reductase 1 [hydrothermal vent metagenome]|uniref:FolM Alternative dihydrofolate reductase 1 n=1 Tax=hydrothermal vent metagenome TaxID=652676 RepID=A0A3B0ZHU9_9ZZZZ